MQGNKLMGALARGPQGNYQRVSPGVYRNAQGQTMQPRGGTMPRGMQAPMTQPPQQPQMQNAFQQQGIPMQHVLQPPLGGLNGMFKHPIGMMQPMNGTPPFMGGTQGQMNNNNWGPMVQQPYFPQGSGNPGPGAYQQQLMAMQQDLKR